MVDLMLLCDAREPGDTWWRRLAEWFSVEVPSESWAPIWLRLAEMTEEAADLERRVAAHAVELAVGGRRSADGEAAHRERIRERLRSWGIPDEEAERIAAAGGR